MMRILACAAAGCMALTLCAVPEAAAQKKVVLLKTWKGSVANEKASKPTVIVSAKAMRALWKEWNAPGKTPKVDFSKEMIVAVYSAGSSLNMVAPVLDANGNLKVIGFGTRDFRPGFRYVLGAVSKEGVKTVNGKELPKEQP